MSRAMSPEAVKFAALAADALTSVLAELEELRPQRETVREVNDITWKAGLVGPTVDRVRALAERHDTAVAQAKRMTEVIDELRTDRDAEKKCADEAALESARQRLRADMAEHLLTSEKTDARRWREAVDGVGDVERYARIAWETQSCRGPWEDSAPAMSRDVYRSEARAIIAAFRARALSHSQPRSAAHDWTKASLDHACSEVRDGVTAPPASVEVCKQQGACAIAEELPIGRFPYRMHCSECKLPRGGKPAFVPVDVSSLAYDCMLWPEATQAERVEALREVVLELAKRENERAGRT